MLTSLVLFRVAKIGVKSGEEVQNLVGKGWKSNYKQVELYTLRVCWSVEVRESSAVFYRPLQVRALVDEGLRAGLRSELLENPGVLPERAKDVLVQVRHFFVEVLPTLARKYSVQEGELELLDLGFDL